jgi:hypothetical protein
MWILAHSLAIGCEFGGGMVVVIVAGLAGVIMFAGVIVIVAGLAGVGVAGMIVGFHAAKLDPLPQIDDFQPGVANRFKPRAALEGDAEAEIDPGAHHLAHLGIARLVSVVVVGRTDEREDLDPVASDLPDEPLLGRDAHGDRKPPLAGRPFTASTASQREGRQPDDHEPAFGPTYWHPIFSSAVHPCGQRGRRRFPQVSQFARPSARVSRRPPRATG